MKYIIVIALLLSNGYSATRLVKRVKNESVVVVQVEALQQADMYYENEEEFFDLQYNRIDVTPVKEETTFDGEWLLYGMMLLPLLAL